MNNKLTFVFDNKDINPIRLLQFGEFYLQTVISEGESRRTCLTAHRTEVHCTLDSLLHACKYFRVHAIHGTSHSFLITTLADTALRATLKMLFKCLKRSHSIKTFHSIISLNY